MIRALEDEKEAVEAEVLAKNSTLRSLETQKSNNSKKRNRVEADIGKCKGEKERNEKEKTELAKKLRDVCHKYGFSSSASAGAEGSRQDMTLGEMEELIDNLSGMLKVKREELSETEQNFQHELETKTKAISDFKEEKAVLEEKLKSKRLEKADAKREIHNLSEQLAKLKGAEAQLGKITAQLNTKEADLKETKGRVDLTRLRESLDVNKTTLKKLEDESQKLQAEKKKFELVRDKTLLIKSKREDEDANQKALDLLLSKKNSELVTVFGSAAAVPPPKDLKQEFLAKSKAVASKKRDLEDRARSLNTTL